MILTLDGRVYKKKKMMEDFVLTFFNENYKGKLMRKFFFIKVTRWLFGDCGIVSNEKKNKKDFYWSFFQILKFSI